MNVAVTGTPGTGKTTATDLVESDLSVVHLNDVIHEEGLYEEVDEERDSLVADLDAVIEWFEDRTRSDDAEDGILVESHLAHHLPVEKVIVLRCHPEELERRLVERGEPESKARENAESEALDVILSEAVAGHGLDAVYEVDTTDVAPEGVADAIEDVIAGERTPSAGEVSFVEYL